VSEGGAGFVVGWWDFLCGRVLLLGLCDFRIFCVLIVVIPLLSLSMVLCSISMMVSLIPAHVRPCSSEILELFHPFIPHLSMVSSLPFGAGVNDTSSCSVLIH
jgi:hypothetical protein